MGVEGGLISIKSLNKGINPQVYEIAKIPIKTFTKKFGKHLLIDPLGSGNTVYGQGSSEKKKGMNIKGSFKADLNVKVVGTKLER